MWPSEVRKLPKGDTRKMNQPNEILREELAVRIDESNLNHHIWNNNGTWWAHYTVYPSPVTAERRRKSLSTKDVTTARFRRDRLFEQLGLALEAQAA